MSFGSPDYSAAWHHALLVTRPALLLALRDFLVDVQHRLDKAGVRKTIAARDPAPLFDWLIDLIARQGITSHAAIVDQRWRDREVRRTNHDHR